MELGGLEAATLGWRSLRAEGRDVGCGEKWKAVCLLRNSKDIS